MKLKSKSFIVTGGTRGIGAALVRKLAIEGANVAFSFLSSADAARELERECSVGGARIFGMCADVRDRAAVGVLVNRAAETFGGIDVVVNNAHQAYEAKWFEEADWADFERELQTLVGGTFNVVQACLPIMKQRGGTIINIGSTMALSPRPRHSFYVTAKCALMGLTEAMAIELGKHGIRVNMVTPGPLETAHNASYPLEVMKRLGEETPLHGRIASVEEVADVIALLATDEARVLTGAHILASGGFAIA